VGSRFVCSLQLLLLLQLLIYCSYFPPPTVTIPRCVTHPTGSASCDANKDPWPVVYPNSLSALSAAELVRRIAQHRELPQALQFPGAEWKDIQVLLAPVYLSFLLSYLYCLLRVCYVVLLLFLNCSLLSFSIFLSVLFFVFFFFLSACSCLCVFDGNY
jgi:hypothetical protein